MKAPFPYFGGKRTVADVVWAALGEPQHYMEPFFGSGAVLLARPDWKPGCLLPETVCDADGHLANVWRALQFSPDEVARWCDWPVNHADLMARKREMIKNEGRLLEGLVADPKWHDPVMAGYWIWAASCWIGAGLTCPGQRPHLGDAGVGVHALGQRPHLGDAGVGVHALGQRPHLGDAGRGVHALGKRPHLNAEAHVQEPYNTNLYAWFRELSQRLRYVRVVCGDWSRICGGNWQNKGWKSVGIFFDPPYGEKAKRAKELYHQDSMSVADAVRAWALERGKIPSYRIVIAGYFEEHESLLAEGWTVHRWKAGGGYANIAGKEKPGANRHKEALFMSPHCRVEAEKQQRLL